MIRRIASLAVLTFKEGVRDRALYGIGLFSLMLMGLSVIIVSFFMRELHKVAVDINISAITFAALLLTLSVSINLMAKDMDKFTIYCVLSKPFSRTQYLIGKFAGLVLLNGTAIVILTMASSLTILLIKTQYGGYFKMFAWAGFFKAVYAEFLMIVVLNTVVVFFSTITSSSFLTLLFSISTYIAGQTIEDVVFYIQSQVQEIPLSEGVRYIIEVTQYIAPNFSAFDLKIKAAHGLAISGTYLAAITGYSFIYSMVLMLLASMIFQRRELT